MSGCMRSWGRAVDSLTIELPWPVAALSPNARDRWGGIKARKAAKSYSWAITLGLMRAMGIQAKSWQGAIAVGIVFHPAIDRERDLDNFQAMMKASLDGIALALGVDDKQFRPVSTFGAKRRPARVLVTLTRV